MTLKTSLTDRIKQETAEAHLALEQLDILSSLNNDNFMSKKNYQHIIKKFFIVISSLEKSVQAHLKLYPDANHYFLPCGDALWLDLQSLETNIKIPMRPINFKVECDEDFYSILYILNGSKLGAKIINKNLTKYNQHLPNQYFCKCACLNLKWNNFCEILNKRDINATVFIQNLLGLYNWITRVFQYGYTNDKYR